MAHSTIRVGVGVAQLNSLNRVQRTGVISRCRDSVSSWLHVTLLAALLFKEEESVIDRGRDKTSESKRMATQVNATVHLHPTRFP